MNGQPWAAEEGILKAISHLKAGESTVVEGVVEIAKDAEAYRGLDMGFTLNIDNVFNKDPPVLLRNNPNDVGFGNGFTLGRLFKFGVTKKF